MKNNFAQEYAREEEIRAAYNTAKETGNEARIEKAKADMRSLNEEIGAKGDAYAFVYRLYQEMKEAGNEHIDLHDTIRDERLQGLIELNSPHMNWFTGTREKVHGYLFSIQ